MQAEYKVSSTARGQKQKKITKKWKPDIEKSNRLVQTRKKSCSNFCNVGKVQKHNKIAN